MFWNCRGYPWNKGLGLKDVAQGMDIILLAETWEHEAKRIPKIDGYLIKSIWPHSKGIIGRAGIACIYHESLDNSIKVCKYDDYKRYIWIEVTLGKEKLYIVACYIPHKDSNYYSRFGLDCDDPFTELCHDIISFEAW